LDLVRSKQGRSALSSEWPSAGAVQLGVIQFRTQGKRALCRRDPAEDVASHNV
jgi:hypothetical protein